MYSFPTKTTKSAKFSTPRWKVTTADILQKLQKEIPETKVTVNSLGNG